MRRIATVLEISSSFFRERVVVLLVILCFYRMVLIKSFPDDLDRREERHTGVH